MEAAGVQPTGDVDSEISQFKGDPESELLSTQLEEALGTRVRVRKNGERGKIMIQFYSREELENILNKIIHSSDNLLREPPALS